MKTPARISKKKLFTVTNIFLNTNFPRNRIKTKHCQYLPCMTRRSRGNTTHKYPNINANPEVSHKYSVFALQFDPDSPPAVLAALILLEQNSSFAKTVLSNKDIDSSEFFFIPYSTALIVYQKNINF